MADLMDLTNQERLGYIIGALAHFAEMPRASGGSDLNKALKEYQDAWIQAHGDDEQAFVLNEYLAVAALRALRMALIDRDPDCITAMQRLIAASNSPLSGGGPRVTGGDVKVSGRLVGEEVKIAGPSAVPWSPDLEPGYQGPTIAKCEECQSPLPHHLVECSHYEPPEKTA